MRAPAYILERRDDAHKGEKTYAVTSTGLWKQREVLGQVLEGRIRHWLFQPASRVDAYIGWGGRPSADLAQSLAARSGKPCAFVEDGFLSAFAPGGQEPRHSYVVDWSGRYFDRNEPSDLRTLIEGANFPHLGLDRARTAIASIRRLRLSKYNNGLPLHERFLERHQNFVLLVDQLPGDASIPRELDFTETCRRMVKDARAEHPGSTLLIRRHPANQTSSPLGSAAAALGITAVEAPPCNPWDLLEHTRAVYTVSSHLGFEALMAEKAVTAYGAPFYAGWKLTTDRFDIGGPKAKRGLEEVFAAAYLRYARYIDVHSGTRCDFDTALSQLATIRDAREALPKQLYTAGFSPWRRWALGPYLTGGKVVHCRDRARAGRMAKSGGGAVALWGSMPKGAEDTRTIRFEDGFIRSVGLGADLYRPYSICVDGDHLYYDARGPSGLEKMLQAGGFDEAIVIRARHLRQRLVASRISKYNVDQIGCSPPGSAKSLRIFVPGQVLDDASVRLGAPAGMDNRKLVARVRSSFPDAFIAFKTHPDVAAGLRDGGPVPQDADLVTANGSVVDWLDWCDRVETLTSLAGFEALLRCKPVGVYGTPFYAGWGLTIDYEPIPRRTRKVTLDELVAASLILYPLYIHPDSKLPCSAEELVTALEDKAHATPQRGAGQMMRRTGALLLSRWS